MIKDETKDITDALFMTKDNLRIIFDSVYDAIIIHDLQGKILYVNKRMLQLYQVDFDVARGMAVIDLSASDNDFEQLPLIWEQVLAGEEQFFQWRAKSLKDESVFDVEVYLTRISFQDQDVILANVRDISEKKKTEEIIKQLSFHDKLTGLYNRAFFEKELKRLDVERQLPISIIIGDINGLKLTNDAFGHLEGDNLLRRISNVLKKSIRKEDILARWGGDEFAILLTKASAYTAAKTCKRIQHMCKQEKAKPIPLSIALGYATKKKKEQDIFDVIKDAERIMYENKLHEGKENRQRITNALLDKMDQADHDYEKMTILSLKLAKAYGLKGSILEDIKLLASIHDIGKASIPREILLKPGPLNQEEWAIVKKHSEVGYRITSTLPEYTHVAEDILAHHERWDGSGYPRGLKGEEIPILARIISIVDAYEVIISGRPYKAAQSHKEALQEIERHGGSQFDPELTNLFLSIMSSLEK
ncbi:PAS domain S-box-containing protein/diguanylate cyclase (GGDEF) domain-containing protein [Natronincola peptidivorans]|uniref:PAS domain S-box-containing protein/diguanylate cyclase (GGDEF) domain-containing protein n=1 Tax=Natronincola peptidivorans TaxID=426128 RepID=A0A1I0F5P0_9FIRM|nr:HD domain-containing phosphohydrolase [Natronincola peptidivorans]SET52556.1 PAS domain S-box-containing protein/diguanylate cyclase (GGDEF) domain-containing protein [Natronincola peptidivorans]